MPLLDESSELVPQLCAWPRKRVAGLRCRTTGPRAALRTIRCEICQFRSLAIAPLHLFPSIGVKWPDRQGGFYFRNRQCRTGLRISSLRRITSGSDAPVKGHLKVPRDIRKARHTVIPNRRVTHSWLGSSCPRGFKQPRLSYGISRDRAFQSTPQQRPSVGNPYADFDEGLEGRRARWRLRHEHRDDSRRRTTAPCILEQHAFR